LQEPLAGPSQGATVNLEPMLDDYYREMGFDNEGMPESETLERLSLQGLQ
jgi:aldehyde:ferredoxin oxidoreductase